MWADRVDNLKKDLAEGKTITYDRANKSEALLEHIGYRDASQKGYTVGFNAADTVVSLFDRDIFGTEPFESDPSPYVAGKDDPITVRGMEQGGAVKGENEDDIEWMRKLAERDYVARISQNTLVSNIRVEFSGPITKEADVDGLAMELHTRWVQPENANGYMTGDKVIHNNIIYESLIDNNVWEPRAGGSESLWIEASEE